MVTKRGGSRSANLVKRKVSEYMEDLYGRRDITRRREVETTNSEGRITNITQSDITVTGDLQFDSKIMKEYIDLGVAKTGDGIFYVESKYDVVVHDKIVVDSVTWELINQIEGETIGDQEIYKGFIARRQPNA